MERNVSSHDREYQVFCDTKPFPSYGGSVPFDRWKARMPAADTLTSCGKRHIK